AALVVDDKAALDGLTEAQIEAAAAAAKGRKQDGKWMLTLQNTTQQPPLAELTDRDTRKALFEKSWTRAEQGDDNDTRATVLKLAKLRAEEAKLLGHPTWAAWKLTDQMAKTPQRVEEFMGKLAPAVVAQAKREAKDIQAQIEADDK